MLKSLSILIFLCCIQFVPAQEIIKKYVKKNTVKINSITPDSINYSDLEAIGNSIGNSRVVMLGEQDHGDAPTFLAKTRLIKYLHEKKGFNVLAFESDFFGLNFGWDELSKTPQSVSKFIHQNIFPIWTACSACNELFNMYIPDSYNTVNPIIVSGFDNQMILSYSSRFLIPKLDSVLKSIPLSITKKENYQNGILPLIDSMRFWYFKLPSDTNVFLRSGQYLSDIKEETEKELGKNNFWMMVIENLIQENQTFKNNRKESSVGSNTRDRQMALNLKWLLENKYPNDKIIVWAANYHVAKYADTLSNNIENRIMTMGSFFTIDPSLMDNTYILGFTSHSGEAGRLGFKNFTIRKPISDGFENWINTTYDYAFTDFKKYRLQKSGIDEKFFLKGLGHQTMFKYNWVNVFDGVFYIKTMYPCEK